MKICRGGKFGERSECDTTAECPPDRTVDVRTGPREYVPVGKVCRPKNGDGYSITSGVDTPESCRKKCDDDATKCGAWEFEEHDFDNKECELHEIDVVSYQETMAMGDCEIANTTGNGDYRCCWIAKDIVAAQTEKDSIVVEEDTLSSVSRNSHHNIGTDQKSKIHRLQITGLKDLFGQHSEVKAFQAVKNRFVKVNHQNLPRRT